MGALSGRFVFAFALMGMGVSCRALPELEVDACGNGVVEAGEACDLFVPPDLSGQNVACGDPDPDSVLQCRFYCNSIPDRAPFCPRGWACGDDRVCRVPAGSFVPASRGGLVFSPAQFDLGDFDGDGRPDVMGVAEGEVLVLFGGPGGAFQEQVREPTGILAGAPTVAQLDPGTDPSPLDLLLPLNSGVHVMLGAGRRVLAPQIYASIDLGAAASVLSARPFSMTAPVPCLGDLPVIMWRVGPVLAFRIIPEGSAEADLRIVVPAGADLAALEGPLPRADLDGDGRDEVAIVFPGLSSIYIVGLGASSGELCSPDELVLERRQTLDIGAPAAAARFADVDGDGAIDLVLLGGANDATVRVAQGDGRGGLAFPVVDRRFEGPFITSACPPEGLTDARVLAAGDLNRDGVADFVGSGGVLLAVRTATVANGIDGAFECVFPPASGAWTEAVIADVDGNGRPDVVAASESGALEVLVSAAPRLFNGRLFSTGTGTRLLRSGDFDGDLAGDVAFVTQMPRGGPAQSRLQVLYGERSGVIGGPVAMGDLPEVRFVESARLRLPPLPDARTDLLVQATANPNAELPELVAILQGLPGRRLFAPIVLPDRGGFGSDEPPLSVHAGQYDDESPVDLAVIARAPISILEPKPGVLWVLPGLGEAQFVFDADSVAPAPICGGLDFGDRCVVSAGGDLDGDARDEVVIVDGSTRCGAPRGPSRVCVVRPALPESCQPQLPLDLVGAISVELADLDRDGFVDLVVAFSGDGEAAAGVAVYPGTGDSVACFFGAPSVLRPAELVPLPLLGVVALNLDGDEALELAVLALDGVHRADPVAGGGIEEAPMIAEAGFGSSGTIRASDLDRDGAWDLIFGNGDRLHVYLATPREAR